MKKTDRERILRIISLWDELKKQVEEKHITKENLMTDLFFQWAVTTPVSNIGEEVYFLSDDTKEKYPDVPWSLVAGLRHRLVHDYEGINWSVIVEVIFDDLEPLIEQLKTIVEEIS